ncbi:hypothetical protein FE783_10210 [Paenibacillus mesophilus]|uniref:DUF6220 domain-containing protein n=1 Tax=Paenibacillus mesophilus TaxID=2582849 RepID=UPI00110D86D1|nr:DUF6220 domain-containing protein [Paenibacillus mesophilus]TMV49940.1 hypothetical protein FE783_10210 [Paenibacillus mesophilus]
METSAFSISRTMMTGLTWIFAGAVLIQIFFAGLALFVNSSHWTYHEEFANYLSFLPIIIFALTFIGKHSRRLRLHTAALIGMIIVMVMTGVFSSQIGILSAFHPVIAVFLFYRSLVILRLIADQ